MGHEVKPAVVVVMPVAVMGVCEMAYSHVRYCRVSRNDYDPSIGLMIWSGRMADKEAW